MNKQCTKCRSFQDLKSFNRDRSRKDGLTPQCKSCIASNSARWQQNNREKVRISCRKWQQENKQYFQVYNAKRYAEQGDMLIQKARDRRAASDDHKIAIKKWKSLNHGKVIALNRKRVAGKIQRTPPWLSSDDFAKIEAFYWDAFFWQNLTGIKFAVDHIVPLRGKQVSGLHVPWNLQVITAQENCHKRNFFGA